MIGYEIIKRMFDITASGVALIILSPFFLIIGLIVKLSSPGPALFRQVRIGRHGKPFTLVKFRTMVIHDQKTGTLVTARDDPRITTIGRLLRRTKLDELPELWNVFIGDMSLVGYRPEVPQYVKKYRTEWRRILEARPGITDPVTLQFIDEEAVLAGVVDRERAYTEVILPIKMELILKYLERRSLRLDFQILVKTVWAVTFGRFFNKPDDEYTQIARQRIEELTKNRNDSR